MSHLSAHVLDASLGAPATGVTVELASADGEPIASVRTDADGRADALELSPYSYTTYRGS